MQISRPTHAVFFLLAALILWCASTAAADTGTTERVLRVNSTDEALQLAPWIDILEDQSRQLGIYDMVKKDLESSFLPCTSRTLNMGVTDSAFWLRFRLGTDKNAQPGDNYTRVLDLGEAFPGRINWSLYNGVSGNLLAAGGSPNAENEYAVLEITRQPGVYYLKIESTTGFLLNPRLFSWNAYLKHINLHNIWFGVFYGVIIAVGIYNLFLFFSFNDNSYLWYVLHLVASLLYFLGINGINSIFFEFRDPELSGILNRSFLGMMIASMTIFTRSFLMTRSRAPKTDSLILALFIFSCILTVINLMFNARIVVALLVMMGILVPSMMVIAAWNSLKSGFKPARMFMAAWGFFVIGVLLFALTNGGIIPFTMLTFNGFQMGAGLAAILLSIALGYRIRDLREERASFKQSMKRVTMILDSMESGVFLIRNNSQVIQEINQAAEKMIGQNRENIIGRHCWEFIRSRKKGACDAAEKCMAEGSREDSLLTSGGRKIPVLKRAKQIELDGRDLILESFVDISDLKRAEKAVLRSEAKFRSLFESSRDAVMIIDDGRFAEFNNAAQKMFGCQAQEDFIGKRPADFSPPEQPSGEESILLIREYMDRALKRGSHFFEWVSTRLNNEAFPTEIMLSEVEVEGKKMLQALIRDITKRKAMENELKRLAATDPLTGADNRRSFLEKGAYELLRSRRYNHPLSLLMLDIDHFKQINDNWGHHTGDRVLIELVAACRQEIRDTDLFGRLGGEEFAVILPETDAESAAEAGERLRNALSAVRVQSEAGEIRFTVSIGLAMLENSADTLVSIMGRADAALYKAKDEGRNRLVCQRD